MNAIAALVLFLSTPACSAPTQERSLHTHFSLCHDSEKKVPTWVGYELTPDQLIPTESSAPAKPRFQPDPNLAMPAATANDYRHSGFTRGHLAPAADFAFSQEARRETYVLSNAIPQHQRVNCGRWSQLEAAVRQIAAQSTRTVIFTGPIFDPSAEPQFIGPNRVAVPTHTYKVVLAIDANGHRTMFAAIVPNTSEPTQPLRHYLTTVDEVERRTSLDFFAFLNDDEENQLESTSQPLGVHN